MKTIANTFFKGLLAFLPAALTVYAVYAFGTWLNRLSGALLDWLIPGLPDVPGLGIVSGLVAVFVLGLLVTSRLTRWIVHLVEAPLRHVPVVKDVYSAIRQLTTLLTPGEKGERGQVVAVRHPDHPVALVGLMMRGDTADLDPALARPDTVAVYLPMSYQIGGYTLFVPRAWVEPMDMGIEAAMRHALTGWMQSDDAGTRPPVGAA